MQWNVLLTRSQRNRVGPKVGLCEKSKRAAYAPPSSRKWRTTWVLVRYLWYLLVHHIVSQSIYKNRINSTLWRCLDLKTPQRGRQSLAHLPLRLIWFRDLIKIDIITNFIANLLVNLLVKKTVWSNIDLRSNWKTSRIIKMAIGDQLCVSLLKRRPADVPIVTGFCVGGDYTKTYFTFSLYSVARTRRNG